MDWFLAILRAALALGLLLGLCCVLSENRSRIDWRLVAVGVGFQAVLAAVILKAPAAYQATRAAAGFFYTLTSFGREGAQLVFGEMADDTSTYGIAFLVLPTIIFFSALSAALYHLRVLQPLVYGFAWLLNRALRLSGAETLAAAANVFLGQTEAPLVVRPYLPGMTRSEIMALMTGGMATIAGGVLMIYMSLLGGGDKEGAVLFGQHLLTASLLSAPAALVAAKILAPQTEAVDREMRFSREMTGSSLLDAVTKGTADGVRLALNVGGMLIAFTALVALANWLMAEGVGSWTGLNAWTESWTGGRFEAFDLSFGLGLISAPFAYLMGVTGPDVLLVGQLLGERLALNEFISYLTLVELREEGAFESERSIIISTYALCGFANLTSVGIQVGGIGALEPSQRANLLRYGMKSMLGGMIACYMTAVIASTIVFT